jgi:hypothetical protein
LALGFFFFFFFFFSLKRRKTISRGKSELCLFENRAGAVGWEADRELSTRNKGMKKSCWWPEKKLTLLQKGNRRSTSERDRGEGVLGPGVGTKYDVLFKEIF